MSNENIDLTVFLKESYFFEIDRKDKISNRIIQPITVLSFLIALIGAASKDIRYPFTTIEAMQIAAILVSGAYIAKSLFCLSKFFFGYKYKYIATTLDIFKYYEQLLKCNSEKKSNPELTLLNYLHKSYTESTHVNATNNDKKSELLYKLNKNMLISLFPISILCVLYLINNIFFK